MITKKPITMISGTLIKEVRQAETPNTGRLVTNTTVQFEDDEGTTHRVPVKAWDEMAESLGTLCVGDEVSLKCTLEQERWRNKTTKKQHSRICLVAEAFLDDE